MKYKSWMGFTLIGIAAVIDIFTGYAGILTFISMTFATMMWISKD